MLSSCPFCHISLPFPELEWHANNHLEEDELARDMELAEQIALASPSFRLEDEQMGNVENSAQTSNHRAAMYKDILDQEVIYNLVNLQLRGTFYRVEAGLMALLRRCLESENKNCTSVICSHIDHYQSIQSEDSGWGCGWRNIQMLSSHLMIRKEAREILFGGSEFVPDIPSLQRWLEIAWERGFDIPGSKSFNQKIYGLRRWIGTTECATLVRSFGLRGRIVDFDSLSSSPSTSTALGQEDSSGGQRMMKKFYGPMDKFLQKRKCDDFQERPSNGKSWHEESNTRFGPDKYEGIVKGHQVLMDWVWNYFTHGRSDVMQQVLISERTPLYFQHDGHSRTIVGIQKQQGGCGSQDRLTLLVLDPAQRTADLERSLTNKNGWQQLIKRGVHTLKKPQYQLCYVDPGIAKGEELEQLKTIDSIYVKF